MALKVNTELLEDTNPDGSAKLPDGVWLVEDCPDPLPKEWVELFRTADKVYGIKRHVDPSIVFRMMRAIRKNNAVEVAMAHTLYDALGEPVMDVLADDGLTTEEMEQVMAAVQKHLGAAFNRIAGN